MDTSHLIRDRKKVLAAIASEADGKIAISKGEVKIYFPKHYLNGKLGYIDSNFHVTGIFAMVVDDKYYGVSVTNAVMSLTPTGINVVKIDGDEYYELYFPPGSVICPDLDLVKDNQLVYQINHDIINLGKTPWQLDIDLLCRIWDTAKLFSDVDLQASSSVLEIKIASRARDPDNLMHYRKEDFKTRKDVETLPVTFVAQRAVAFTTTNATARLLGANLKDGIMAEIVNPSTKNELFEDVLRGNL